jgi:hypothetical protein
MKRVILPGQNTPPYSVSTLNFFSVWLTIELLQYNEHALGFFFTIWIQWSFVMHGNDMLGIHWTDNTSRQIIRPGKNENKIKELFLLDGCNACALCMKISL